MGRRKSEDFDDEDLNYFDELVYNHDDEEDDEDLDIESEIEEDYESSPILDEVSISDIVNEHGIDEFADAVIDSISYHDLERLRDRINEYLE